jgi:hypothetical protein
MNTISKFALAGFVALALATGCDDHDHDHDHSGATTQGAAAQDHGHGHGHDHAHGGETHEPLGLENAGPYEVAPVQLGKLKPGGEIAFDVEILGQGQPKPKAVRFWIGSAGADAGAKVPPESEKDNVYHVDLTVPPAPTAQTRLWVEIEPASGPVVRASFALKQ